MKNITILKEYHEKEYTIIDRHTSYLPIVACWCFHKETNTWESGHYFETLTEAYEYVEAL